MSNLPQSPAPGAVSVDQGDQFKIAQAIYNAVTGKTEKLSKAFSKNYLIKLDDFYQLDQKCSQACSQWEVLQKNCSITVNHLDDNKEVFSSIERFKIYDMSRKAPTESVTYEFNLLLRLPDTEKPQPYKITVRAMSQVTMLERMHRDMTPPSFIRLFSAGGVVVEIDYVDYVVARNMLSMIESWINEVETAPKCQWLKPIQRLSHWIPPFVQLIVVGIVGWSLFITTESVFSADDSNRQLAEWIILGGLLFFLTAKLSKFAGRLIESGVDRIGTANIILLNKGDSALQEKFRRKACLRFAQVIGGVLFVISQGVTANFLTDIVRRIMTDG